MSSTLRAPPEPSAVSLTWYVTAPLYSGAFDLSIGVGIQLDPGVIVPAWYTPPLTSTSTLSCVPTVPLFFAKKRTMPTIFGAVTQALVTELPGGKESEYESDEEPIGFGAFPVVTFA